VAGTPAYRSDPPSWAPTIEPSVAAAMKPAEPKLWLIKSVRVILRAFRANESMSLPSPGNRFVRYQYLGKCTLNRRIKGKNVVDHAGWGCWHR
jgi:hypothetical protein